MGHNAEKLLFRKGKRESLHVSRCKRGKLAADIGAGSGFITEGLVKNRVRVIAIDYSKNMIEEIKKKFLEVKGIDYRVGSIDSLPIMDETVDYVFYEHGASSRRFPS
jgi:ubiquinone/menaquinone biosynthesis C-methylase UbiE